MHLARAADRDRVAPVRRRSRELSTARAGFFALAVALVWSWSASPASAFEPAINYQLHCQGCHLADGRATPGLVPALDPTLGRMMRVPEGRDYLVRLPNVAAAQLDPADTAALLNWLLAHFAASELPPDFAAITTEEVIAGRRAPLVDVEGTRAAVLRRADGGAR
ncbi:hypothetical protein K2Z84_15855 [Candidatus Binatia bacterium]|jgi:mono/diheme cytochrome c family protein|nr:hypothetical protein [Candidatus Binatia bacterium]